MVRMDSGTGSLDIEWHVGGVVDFAPERVVVLEADGDELGLLIRDFHNLPFHNGRTNVFYGDMAKMIAERIFQFSDKNRKEQARKG